MTNHHKEFATALVNNLIDESQDLNKGQVIITVHGLLNDRWGAYPDLQRVIAQAKLDNKAKSFLINVLANQLANGEL